MILIVVVKMWAGLIDKIIESFDRRRVNSAVIKVGDDIVVKIRQQLNLITCAHGCHLGHHAIHYMKMNVVGW